MPPKLGATHIRNIEIYLPLFLQKKNKKSLRVSPTPTSSYQNLVANNLFNGIIIKVTDLLPIVAWRDIGFACRNLLLVERQ